MAHPHRAFARHARIKLTFRIIDYQFCFSILPFRGFFDTPAEDMNHQLRAVAKAENRHSEFKQLTRCSRRSLRIDAVRAAGQDNSLWIHGADLVKRRPVGIDLTVDTALTDTSGYQLVILPAEVNDDDFFLFQE